MSGRPFRIALALKPAGGRPRREFFLGAHAFAHTRPDWEIVRAAGTSLLDWEQALASRPDGILGALVPGRGPTSRRAVGRARVVILNNSLRRHPFVRVVADSFEAGRRAAAHLLERNLLHFGFVGGRQELFSEQRLAGFREALAAAGFRAAAETFDWPEAGRAEDGLRRWLNRLPRPCGLLCADDTTALRVVRALLALGVAVPDEVAVLGVSDDEMVCVESPVTLSSVVQNFQAVGWHAAEQLDRLLRGGAEPAAPVLVPPGEVAVRNSTRTRGERDPLARRALALIHAGGPDPLTTPLVLGRLGRVSRRLLELRIKAETGRSPHQEILHARILHARRLLRGSRLPMAEIAQVCGFYDQAQFSRHFRKACGCTPSHYRRVADQLTSAERSAG